MATAVVEHAFTGVTTTSYDPTKTTLGSLMVQNAGTTAKDKWVGPRPTIHTQLYDTIANVSRNRMDVSGGTSIAGSASYWSNPERMYGGVCLHGKCDEGIVQDILFTQGEKQDLLMKTNSITPAGVDDFVVGLAADETILHGPGGTLIMSTTGTLNPANDIVSDLGSITMIIPSGTVNEPVDILVDGDFDQIPETEYVGVPNAVIRLPKKVR